MTPLKFQIRRAQGGVRAYPTDPQAKAFTEALGQTTLTLSQLRDFQSCGVPFDLDDVSNKPTPFTKKASTI